MFVSDRRIILKTCGQTRPLVVIGELLELARTHCQMDTVTNVRGVGGVRMIDMDSMGNAI